MKSMRTHAVRVLVLMLTTVCLGATSEAQTIDEMQRKATQFLEVTQNADGSWTSSDAVGITGLVTTSLIMSGRATDDPMVKKGLDLLIASQQASGGIHASASRHRRSAVPSLLRGRETRAE